MRARSQTSGTPNGNKSNSDVVGRRAPIEKPPFTLEEIKKAIPRHCFQRSLLRSLSYVVADLTIVFLLYSAATTYFHLLPRPLLFLAWPLYWIFQGCVLTGLWNIAHECGHHAFSNYQIIDDAVGLILHTALLVPYFSWKHSHRRHHANTGSLERDEVYVPQFKSNVRWYYKYFNNPPGRVLVLFTQLIIGFPLYLLCNVSGRSYDRFTSHFHPSSPIYTDRERIEIYISDVGLAAVAYGLYRWVAAKGFAWVFSIYGVPLLIVNGFFVLITYLHHTHTSLPHYDSSEWDWLRGALSTVDRDYGILNKVFHHAADTHVMHHLLSAVPHYHAEEAAEAIKPVLGEYYQFDGTPILKAMYREMKECIYIESDERKKGVFWYKNKL